MSLVQETALPAADARSADPRAFLYGPVADFMLLGGGALIAMAAIWLFLPASYAPTVLFASVVLANFFNHPHFAHSYQIFYGGFRGKAFGGHYSATLRLRYIFAGIVAPALLAAYLLGTFAAGEHRALGLSVNAMAFFVGWHYVKQGYGMLMLDAAIKKRFFSQTEKRVFLAHAYSVWIFAWLNANQLIADTNLWGLKSYSFAIPAPFRYVALASAAVTLVACIYVLFHRHRAGRKTPWNGLVGYFVSLYPWLMPHYLGPSALFVVPTFHSLQYLAVVWRYQLNRERAEMEAGSSAHGSEPARISQDKVRFATFLTKGMLLGFIGFWGLPVMLDLYVPYDRSALGSDVFLGMFWLFINVHHYFLDNVMWRRENTDMKKYLFG